MRLLVVTLFGILGALPPLAAGQDSVKLLDGTLYRGEIRRQTDDEVTILTTMGELRTFSTDQILRAHRGRPLDEKVAARLESINARSADALFRVARWAAAQRALKRDAQRVARRVLEIDPEHADAREFLGHVKALGVWYPDRRTARKAVGGEMKARGFVYHRGGWAVPDDLAAIRKTPAEWLVDDDMCWRLVADVMRARGMLPWESEWYRPDEREVISQLEELAKRINGDYQGARAGACEVLGALSRKKAAENAKRLQETREWFVETFDAKDHRLLRGPVSRHYVLLDRPDFIEFTKVCKDWHRTSPNGVKLALRTNSLPFPPFDHAIHLDRELWEQSLVSQLAGRLLERVWSSAFECPDWLWISCAHHAEVAAFGEAAIWYLALDEYGRGENDPRTKKGRSMKDVRRMVKDMYKRGKVPSLRQLFRAKTNHMTADLDTLGMAYLKFLLAVHREALLDFLMGASSDDCARRFEEYFGKGYADMEKEFRAWVGA